MRECISCHQPLRSSTHHCPRCGDGLKASYGGSYGYGSGGSTPPMNPWEDRARLGFVSAFIATTKQVLSSPGDFFSRINVTGGMGGPLIYAVLVGYLGMVASSVYGLILNLVSPTLMSSILGERFPQEAFGQTALSSGLAFAMTIVLGPLFILVGLFIGAGIVHVGLLLVGGAQRGFEATLQTVCYSQATAVIQLVPACGWLIAPLWTIVIYIIGASRAHQISTGKAALGVLLPFVLCCCCCVGGYFLLVAMIAGGAGMLGR